LRLRVARGESLNVEEHAAYEAGLVQLHQEEHLQGDMTALRQARAALAVLEEQRRQWHTQREQLEAEIATIEAALSEHTKQWLGVKA
jgi:multidrug resistance efflux pump